MKLIDLHKEWCESGRLPTEGLCDLFNFRIRGYDELFDLASPEGAHDGCYRPLYWGGDENGEMFLYQYTPLRQTIVLLICAMNNEI